MKRVIYFQVVLLFALAGCSDSYYSEKDFTSVVKVDAHVHIRSDKHDFEEQALKDNFKVLTINYDVGTAEEVKEQLNYALASIKKYPGRVYYAATFRFDSARWGNSEWADSTIMQLKHNVAGGAIAVKFWKNIGMAEKDINGNFIMIDNEKFDPIIDYLITNKIPMVGHFGEPKNCWLPVEKMTVKGDKNYFSQNPKYHMYLHPECPTYEKQIASRDHMLEKHPDLIFISCHLGSLEWDVDELAKRLDQFPNMAADMAGRIVHLQYQSMQNRDKVRNFIIKYQDRLIYGTDLGANENSDPKDLIAYVHKIWFSDWKYFVTNEKMSSEDFDGQFTGLKLPKKVIEKIYSKNARKWYKM
jgi:hypothetical protein